jgi:hypothetical protein
MFQTARGGSKTKVTEQTASGAQQNEEEEEEEEERKRKVRRLGSNLFTCPTDLEYKSSPPTGPRHQNSSSPINQTCIQNVDGEANRLTCKVELARGKEVHKKRAESEQRRSQAAMKTAQHPALGCTAAITRVTSALKVMSAGVRPFSDRACSKAQQSRWQPQLFDLRLLHEPGYSDPAGYHKTSPAKSDELDIIQCSVVT